MEVGILHNSHGGSSAPCSALYFTWFLPDKSVTEIFFFPKKIFLFLLLFLFSDFILYKMHKKFFPDSFFYLVVLFSHL